MIKIKINNPYEKDFTQELLTHIENKINYLIKNEKLLGNKVDKKGALDNNQYVYSHGDTKQQQIKCQLIDKTKEKRVLNYFKKELKSILNKDVKKLNAYIKDISRQFPDMTNPQSNIFKIIKYIFVQSGYESKISNSNDNLIAYRLIKELGIKTCPYCNRNYISYIKNAEKQTRPQLDHFYPKSLYPFLACSFYNLIPCCSACNLMKSDDDSYKDELLSPYNVDDNDFIFSYTLKNLKLLKILDLYNIKHEDENSLNIVLKTKYKKNNKYFQLEKIYQNHKDIVIELILKSIHYPKSYIKELVKSGFGSEDEIYRFIFSNYLEVNDLHKRPLSKLTRDIISELGLLYKIELLIKENRTA